MDISIIIPTYNRLWSLPKAIESCRNNKCAVEIIVVDDGSTDGTREWLESQNDLVILQQEHWGKCWAVNKAFSLAKGKYVRFLDSDDRLAENANDEQYSIAENNSSDIVVSGLKVFDENDNLLNQQLWVECDDFIAQQLGECDSSHYSAYLFRKSFIDDIPHRPDYAYRDDRLFVIEAAIKLPKVNIHPGYALLHMRHEKESLQKNGGMLQTVQNYQHVNIYKQCFEKLTQNGLLTQRRKNAACNKLWHLAHWVAKTHIDDALEIYNWIFQLNPEFSPYENPGIARLYKYMGFTNAERLLRLRRLFR